METSTEPRLQGSTVVRAVSITQLDLAVVLNRRIGPITDDTAHKVWQELAQELGWSEYHRPAPQQVESSKTPTTAEIVPQDASRKRKAPGKPEEDEDDGGLEALGRKRKSGRRAGKKHKRHRSSENVVDTNDSAIAIHPQVSKCSVVWGLVSDLLAKSKPVTRAIIGHLHGLIRAQSQSLVSRHGTTLDGYDSIFFDMVYTERVRDFIRDMADEVLRRSSNPVSVYEQRMAKQMGFNVQDSKSIHQPPSSLFKRAVEKAVMMALFPETEMEEAARLAGVFAQAKSAQELKEMEVVYLWAKRVQRLSGLGLMVESSNGKLSIP